MRGVHELVEGAEHLLALAQADALAVSRAARLVLHGMHARQAPVLLDVY